VLFPLTLATVLLRALVSAMAVTFISQEPCPEAGRKRALPSDNPGALSHENGFPLNNVRVRGQTDPYTQRKRHGAPLRIRDDGLVGAWLQLDPLEAGDRPGRKSRRTLRSRPGGAVPPHTDDFGGPMGKGVPSSTAEARPFL